MNGNREAALGLRHGEAHDARATDDAMFEHVQSSKLEVPRWQVNTSALISFRPFN
jgi:hypothetical protein